MVKLSSAVITSEKWALMERGRKQRKGYGRLPKQDKKLLLIRGGSVDDVPDLFFDLYFLISKLSTTPYKA